MSNHATDTAGVKARDTALQGALTQIERQFGKGTVMRMGDEGAQVKVNAIPTGALSLDLALGIGGMPRGRIVEVFGPESSGKTTLVYHVLAEAQKLGGVCAFIDAEHAMDPLYAQQHRRGHRRAARLPARLRRAGARDRRHARALGRGRRRGGRLRRRADAAGRARGPDGRPDGRPAGADDVAGHAQAGRQPEPHADALPVRQPDPREGRRHVRLAGDPAGRPRAEVLLVPAPGHPPHRDAEGRHGGGRQPRAGQGRQEQGRGAVPPGRVRHRVRQGHLELRLHPRPRDRAQHRREVRLVLLLRRRAARPGPQQRQGLPGRAPRGRQGDRGQGLRGARHRPGPRDADRAGQGRPRRLAGSRAPWPSRPPAVARRPGPPRPRGVRRTVECRQSLGDPATTARRTPGRGSGRAESIPSSAPAGSRGGR